MFPGARTFDTMVSEIVMFLSLIALIFGTSEFDFKIPKTFSPMGEPEVCRHLHLPPLNSPLLR